MTECILFVDDEKLIKRLVSHYFKNHIRQGEYEFIFAYNGIEALDKLKENPQINLVITDINMPEMDGLTLLAKIREFHKDTKSIIVSAYEDLKTIRQAMNLGACDFINKPIDFQDLENSISRTLAYMYQLKQDKSREEQNTAISVVNESVSESLTTLENPINWMSDNLQEAQEVIKTLINQLEIYQKQFTDISPEILKKIKKIEQENLVLNLSKMMISLRFGTEHLEQITQNLIIQIKQN